MEHALETFMTEYKIFLKATKTKTTSTRKFFDEVKKSNRNNGISLDLLNELDSSSRSLFQTNYLLMEYHMRINNIRANYSEKDQKIIDLYDEVSNNATKLIKEIKEYILFASITPDNTQTV